MRKSFLSQGEFNRKFKNCFSKSYYKKAIRELLDTLLRNSHKVKRLKHYYNILPDGRVLDFTHKQLAYRGDIVFGEKISELSLEETFSISEKQGGVFIEKYEILKSNVIEGISCLFACPPQDIVEYLKTKKFKLLV